jgi:acetate kinase
LAPGWTNTRAERSDAVGHRVVHGGAESAAPPLIGDRVLAKLWALVPLALLYQPNNLAPIRSIRARSCT